MCEVKTQKEQRVVRAILAETTREVLDGCRRLSKDEVSTSVMSMRSVCAVSRPVIRNVLRSQTIQQPTRWMSLVHHRQLVKKHKEKLGWNNTSAQPTSTAILTL